MRHPFFSSLFFLLIFTGCAAIDSDYKKAKHVGPIDRVFFEPYEKVWRAAQLALANYTIKINNADIGVLKTERIVSPYMWKPAWQEKKRYPSGRGYIININVVKGRSKRESAVKVLVEKVITLNKNFIDNPQQVPSDGFEEKEILYRIGRELVIESAIRKAH